MPGLVKAVILDLDGVVTDTAGVHAAAWKTLFDAYLARRAGGGAFRPFDTDADYRRYVDGKPRYEGVRSFLASRDIHLPRGEPEDPPGRETVCGLGNRKNALFLQRLRREGATVYPDALDLVRRLRCGGTPLAVVSSSRNCRAVLSAAGIVELFDCVIDGAEAARLELPGKPAPDTFLEAARRLGVEPARVAVIEDAAAGVEAGRRGGFGRVLGVAREGGAAALVAAGADEVVRNLSEVRMSETTPSQEETGDPDGMPRAMAHLDAIRERMRGRRPALFLDYDGTLTPIVDRPERARLDPAMRAAVERVARRLPVAVISGRDLADVRRLVGLEGVYYAGSHGFDIAGPGGRRAEHASEADFIEALDRAREALEQTLAGVDGVLVERKRYSFAVHYRQVAAADVPRVKRAVEDAVAARSGLRLGRGKKVLEVQPAIDWNKGRAVRWLLQALDLDAPDVLPVFLGDDVTDEDAFAVLRADGLGIVVSEAPRESAAHYRLQDPDEVRLFLEAVAEALPGARA